MSAARTGPPPTARGYARSALLGALGAGLVVGGAWCWDALAHADALRMRTVYLHGAFEHVDQRAVFAQLRPHLADNFLALDLDALRRDVEALAWVAHATVRREWPGTLTVAVGEEVPVATWRGAGLLNAAGERFAESAGTGAALPALAGPEGTQAMVLDAWRDMQRLLGPGSPALVRLELSERRAWEAWFGDGTRVLLGRRDALPRLARFVQHAAPLVGPQADHVAYVDMRYPNGFSVGWKSGGPQPTTPGRAAARPDKRKRTDV